MTLKPPELSTYGTSSVDPSPVNRMMAEFAGDFRDNVDVNLGVGYVNEDTIPRELIREALDAVLTRPEKYRVPFNYGGPAGSPNLVQSLREFYLRNCIGGLTEEIFEKREIRIGGNGTSGILEAIADVVKPGIVITSDPMYYIYCNFLERKGYRLITVPEDENGVQPELLEEKLQALGEEKQNIRFLYIVTVSNPTSSILSNERRKRLVEIAAGLCREIGREIPLIFDKAYELLVHDPQVDPFRSGFHDDQLGIVYEVGTLSKVFAPALRIGYLIGPPGRLVELITQKTSDSGFSAPLITQEIASYLLDNHIERQIAKVNQGYQEKAAQVKGRIDEELGPYLETYTGGRAGFYFYLTFREIRTDQESLFFKFLTRTTGKSEIDGPSGNKKPRVVYIPGEFCVHPRGDMVEKGRRQLRISYGFEETERILEALGYMRQAVEFAV